MGDTVERNNQMYECFHCCEKAVVWDADFSFEDYGKEGEGIVQVCHCTNCGAEIHYIISLDEKDIKEVIEKEATNNESSREVSSENT